MRSAAFHELCDRLNEILFSGQADAQLVEQ
jgi:hypothetical protein